MYQSVPNIWAEVHNEFQRSVLNMVQVVPFGPNDEREKTRGRRERLVPMNKEKARGEYREKTPK